MKFQRKKDLKEKLDQLYLTYNKRKYIDPDPLFFLHDYPEKKDREIAAIIASSLAFGRIDQIMRTCSSVLEKLGGSPFDYLVSNRAEDMENSFRGFQYRFVKDRDLINFLLGIRNVIKRFGSLENCFYEGWGENEKTVLSGLPFFYNQISREKPPGYLLADPEKKSACKRLQLFFRWMVRKDEVDPGGWPGVKPSQLVVPLDTHMYRAGRCLGFTTRKTQDMQTAVEITKGFKALNRKDPVRYDFCLTRFGIQRNLDFKHLEDFFQSDDRPDPAIFKKRIESV